MDEDISKVRSLSLDQWEPDLLDMMCGLGNDAVNSVYEANIPEDRTKPTATDVRYDKIAQMNKNNAIENHKQ